MQPIKVVINRCYGGFGLSDEAAEFCIAKGMTVSDVYNKDCDFQKSSCDFERDHYFAVHGDAIEFRSNPIVIEAVETLGKRANGQCSKLRVVEVNISLEIDDHNGMERVVGNVCV